MTDALVFSDSHITPGSAYGPLDLLCRTIEAKQPPLLVMDGDIGDPWKVPWEAIVSSMQWLRLQEMVDNRARQGLQTVWIANNHDHDAKPVYLPGAEIRHEYRRRRFVFRHGWEFALDWKLIGPFAFWIAMNRPEWMVPIYNWLYRTNTPGQIKARLKLGGLRTDPEEYNWQVGMIHAYAERWAKENDVYVIIGHTHLPHIGEYFADAGDQLDSFSFLEITGNNVELKRL